MVCAGLPALDEPDGPEASVKLDWLLDKLTGDWVDQKVVVFSKFKGTIRALGTRLRDADIGMALIWGDMPTERRQEQQRRFWDHPKCRVIVGTSAIERSLNLQVSNIVVNLDTLLNPARMTQILGRIRRVGSVHSHVYVFNLLTRDTQEERYLEVLQKRQALADYVFDESSELYESLSSIELLSLITP
jgi:SNF2 family DNA or RNA helicase